METCNLIHLKRNGADGISYPLLKDSSLVLGRDPDCDYRVQIRSVSDRHAKIVVSNSGKATISSLVPSNPVFMSDAPIQKETVLQDGSTFSLGTCSFKLTYNTGFPASPLMESNSVSSDVGSAAKRGRKNSAGDTPGKELSRTSVTTPKSSAKLTPKSSRKNDGKENAPATPRMQRGSILGSSQGPSGEISASRSSRKATPRAKTRASPGAGLVTTPKSLSRNGNAKATPKTHTPAAKPLIVTAEKSTTPKTASYKKVKVPTPIPSRESSFRGSLGSRKSHLDSIPEMSETPSPANPRVTSVKLFDDSSLGQVSASAKKSRKSVTFGPMLSPEYFDKGLPPRTPVKVGSTPVGIHRSLRLELTIEEETRDSEGESDSDAEAEESGYSLTGFEDSFVSCHSGDASCDETGVEDDFPSEATEDDDTTAKQPRVTPLGRKRKLATPIQHQIKSHPVLRSRAQKKQVLNSALKKQIHSSLRADPKKVARSLPTPIRIAIKEKPSLYKTRRGMPTPIRKDIENKPSLRSTKKSLPTPLKKSIKSKPRLHKAKKSVPTPLRKSIENRPTLLKTRRSMPTPLRKAIEKKPALVKRKKSMPVSLQKEIEEGVVLVKVKKSLPTPLKKDVQKKHVLRKTKKSMHTPLRKQIEGGLTLQKLKNSMPTPLRKDIEKKRSLRKTKQSMPTPLKKEIEGGASLRKTKRSMPTPLREGIRKGKNLLKVRKYMLTPLRKDIERGVSLHKTKQSMPTPIRKEIQAKHTLRKTKQSMPTPLKKEIKARPALRKTKKSMPTPLKKEIKARPALRKTKKSMPTPLKKEIQAKPALRKTKKSMPTPLKKEIQARPALRKTKRLMPVPLQEEIRAKLVLRKTKLSMSTPLRKEIEKGVVLHKTKKALSTPLRKGIQGVHTLQKTKQSLSTPLRKEIEKGVTLKKTKKSLPTPLRKDIHARPFLQKTEKPHSPHQKPLVIVSTKSKKRLIEDTVEAGESPVKQPPAKRMRRMVNTEMPSPNLCGLRNMFATPKASSDAASVFEPRLFENGLGGIHFASPVAFTAKRPEGPKRNSPMSSRLRNKSKPVEFSLDSGVPSKMTRRQKKGVSSVAAIRRNMRSRDAHGKASASSTVVVPEVKLVEEGTAVPSRKTQGRPKETKSALSDVKPTEMKVAVNAAQKKKTRSRQGGPNKELNTSTATNTLPDVQDSMVNSSTKPPRKTRQAKRVASSTSDLSLSKKSTRSGDDSSLASQRSTRRSKRAAAPEQVPATSVNSADGEVAAPPPQRKTRRGAKQATSDEQTVPSEVTQPRPARTAKVVAALQMENPTRRTRGAKKELSGYSDEQTVPSEVTQPRPTRIAKVVAALQIMENPTRGAKNELSGSSVKPGEGTKSQKVATVQPKAQESTSSTKKSTRKNTEMPAKAQVEVQDMSRSKKRQRDAEVPCSSSLEQSLQPSPRAPKRSKVMKKGTESPKQEEVQEIEEEVGATRSTRRQAKSSTNSTALPKRSQTTVVATRRSARVMRK